MRVYAKARLPYLLSLRDGLYGALVLQRVDDAGQDRSYTVVSRVFDMNEDEDPDKRQESAVENLTKLLHEVNMLLRWYRTEAKLSTIVEVTRAQLSPIQFSTELQDGRDQRYCDDLSYEVAPIISNRDNSSQKCQALEERVRAGVDSKNEPKVSDLFLLDAEAAKDAGRFREAVLFSWSIIDSVFVTSFNGLVKSKPDSVSTDTKKLLIGTNSEISLKIKMSGFLFLLTGRSLAFDGSMWKKLDASYKLRNNIIHGGKTADESQAEQSIEVARWVVGEMANIMNEQNTTTLSDAH